MSISAPHRARIVSLIAIVAFTFLALAYLSLIEYIDFNSRRLHVYDQAMSRVNASPQTQQLLGAPVRVGWPIRESGTLSNHSGQARLLIPVSGPSGKGQVIVWGRSHSGQWTITDLELAPDGATQNIYLLAAPATSNR